MRRKHPRPRKFSWLARSLRLEETLAYQLRQQIEGHYFDGECVEGSPHVPLYRMGYSSLGGSSNMLGDPCVCYVYWMNAHTRAWYWAGKK